MTSGHQHREVRIDPSTRIGGAVTMFLRKQRVHCADMDRVDKSPYPYGPCREHEYECYCLSVLSVLHRWTGFTIRTPSEG